MQLDTVKSHLFFIAGCAEPEKVRQEGVALSEGFYVITIDDVEFRFFYIRGKLFSISLSCGGEKIISHHLPYGFLMGDVPPYLVKDLGSAFTQLTHRIAPAQNECDVGQCGTVIWNDGSSSCISSSSISSSLSVEGIACTFND